MNLKNNKKHRKLNQKLPQYHIRNKNWKRLSQQKKIQTEQKNKSQDLRPVK